MNYAEYNWTKGYHVSLENGELDRIYEIGPDLGCMFQVLPIFGCIFKESNVDIRQFGYDYTDLEFRCATQEEIDHLKLCKEKGEFVSVEDKSVSGKIEDGCLSLIHI